jgi:alkanesulfonate monooxygenase SsuD/methylene tetrahydromethanopterin reductase-like flavin-dependent oxidoreductase (luciferase family)
MLKFGLINFLENPAGRSERQIVREQSYLMQRAEEYGFDSVWPVEHHFSEYGHCVSAAVMLGALAAATRVMRLGSGVVPLPFQNPIRVAEEFALVDLLSDGRLEFGIGRGFQPLEFRGYGVDPAKSREIFQESLEIILQAWTCERVNFVGRHFRFEDVRVRPRPLQKPHPPIWMAAVSPQSFQYAGERGFNLICGPIFAAEKDYLEKNLQAYREALRNHGHDPASRQIAALFMLYAAPSLSRAEADFAEAAVWCYHALSESAAPPTGEAPVLTYERYIALRDAGAASSWDLVRDTDAVIWGTPERCIERILDLHKRLGFTTLLAWTRVGSLDNRKVLDSMGLLQDQVMPQVKREIASRVSTP